MVSFLPYEMVWEIYQFLPLRQVLGCSRVSKAWARAARHHRPCEDVNKALRDHAYNENVPLVKAYIKYGADVNAICPKGPGISRAGDTVLSMIMYNCPCNEYTTALIELLLKAGVRATEKNLFCSVHWWSWSKILLKNFILLKTPLSGLTTAYILTEACAFNHVEVLNMVYTLGIPADTGSMLTATRADAIDEAIPGMEMVPYSLERTLMILAIKHEATGIIRALLDKIQTNKDAICGYITYARRRSKGAHFYQLM